MSVSIERLSGYRMICTEESLHEDVVHGINYEKLEKYRFQYDKEEHLKKYPEYEVKFKELETLGFRWIEDVDVFNKNNYFTLIVDGMNGNYVWLVYIEKFKWDEYCLEDEDNTLNEKLKIHPIPQDIDKNMRRIYEIIFNKSHQKSSKKEIYYQEMAHWV